jgi:CRP-like cAMP-binding protein
VVVIALDPTAILATMNADDLRRLEAAGAEAEFPAGCVLIEHGQFGTGLYVILEGTVVVEAPEGVRELGPQAVVGERALLSADGTRTARVRATSDLRVLAVDRHEFELLCADDPDFARRVEDAAA